LSGLARPRARAGTPFASRSSRYRRSIQSTRAQRRLGAHHLEHPVRQFEVEACGPGLQRAERRRFGGETEVEIERAQAAKGEPPVRKQPARPFVGGFARVEPPVDGGEPAVEAVEVERAERERGAESGPVAAGCEHDGPRHMPGTQAAGGDLQALAAWPGPPQAR
jgi:hypothetical protein